MTINKKIFKSYDILYKYNQNNKFTPKKNRSFIHLYLSFLQNKYKFNFELPKNSKQILFSEILNSLYQEIPIRKLKGFLFPDDKLLADIFCLDTKFSIDKFLAKLEENTYTLNYVNTNIQIVDYLGNTDNDISVVKVGFCLLLFQEQFPLIKVNSKLHKNIVSNLVKTAQPIKGQLNYINSQAVLILFLLGKINKFDGLKDYIKLLLASQQNNGLWHSGYNSYLVENSGELDVLHTSLGLINLLEYQIQQTLETKIVKESKVENEIVDHKKIKPDIKLEKVKVEKDNTINPSPNITEEFSNPKKNKKQKHLEIMERFDNINDISNSNFYLDLNFYNTTLILLLVLIAVNIPRIKAKLMN